MLDRITKTTGDGTDGIAITYSVSGG